jgi:predicted MFS family arabinose efflux permease
MGAAYLLLGLIHDIGPLIAVATLASFGQGVLRPTLTSLITQNADRSEQGVVLGLNQSLMSIAQVLAPPLGGLLIGGGLLPEWAFIAALAAGLGMFATRWGSARAHAVVASPRIAES